MINELLESLTKIGNHPRVVKECEPNIAFPQKLETWMVKRTLKSCELFMSQYYKEEK